MLEILNIFNLPEHIPEAWSYQVEVGILVFVFLEFLVAIATLWISILSYKIATRKKGRPRKTKTEKLMIKLSKQLQKTLSKRD